MKYKYLFGPVPSRRLGVSLGVDIVPFKTCTLDCVYCECGETTNLTVERKEYVPISEVIAELEDYLSQKPNLDFITFSGGGEPTINSGIGEIIDFIKDNYPEYKIALLTNGTLFYQKEVRKEILRADLIIPSLDAVSEKVFEKVNRPAPNLHTLEVVKGLQELRKEFRGEIWLEVFIVPGLNDTEAEVEKLKEAAEQINPDKIQLNSLDRPSTEEWVVPATRESLEKIAEYFDSEKVEIIAKDRSRKKIKSFRGDIKESIITTLKRRPCTAEDLSQILELHINEVNKYLENLLREDIIVSDRKERGIFFKVK